MLRWEWAKDSYTKEHGWVTSLVGQWLRLHLPTQGIWVWSLVGELGFHKPREQKAKTWKRSSVITSSMQTLKMAHIKKKKKSFFKTTTKDRHISQMQYRAREITNKRQHNSIIQFVWSSKQVKLAYEIRSEDSGYPEGVGNGRILQGTF